MNITNENKKIAKGVFKSQPDCDVVWVNHKQEYFTSHNLALGSVKDPKTQLAYIKREIESVSVIDKAEDLISLSIGDIESKVKDIADVDLLIGAVQLEGTKQDRKGAKEAIGKRIEELKKQ